MAQTPFDNLIETAAHIWLRERDRNPVPCTILREALHQGLLEYAAPHLAARVTPPPAQCNQPSPRDDHAH
jgi:hypothetical protein